MSQQFFLHNTNPEILTMVPRVGGIANIELPEKKRKRARTSGRSSEDIRSQKSSMSTKSGGASRKSLMTVQTAVEEHGDKVQLEIPKSFVVQEVISSNPWVIEFDDENLNDTVKIIPEKFQEAVDLLICTISTVMLLSKGYKDIPQNYLRWTFSYLKCIKDDFDHNPPNVQGIINHIIELSGDKIKSFLDDDIEVREPVSKVRISTAAPEVAPHPDD